MTELTSKNAILDAYLDYVLGWGSEIARGIRLNPPATVKGFSRYAAANFLKRGAFGREPRFTPYQRACWRRWQEELSKNEYILWQEFEEDKEYAALLGRPWNFIRGLKGRYPKPLTNSWELLGALGAFEMICLIAEKEDPRLISPEN